MAPPLNPRQTSGGNTPNKPITPFVTASTARWKTFPIGPTGKNLVRFACAVHSWDKSHDGVAGHGGLGAVTGAKHLKVVAVTGNRQTTVAHPDAIKTLLNDIREPMKVGTASLKNEAENVLSV